MSDHSVWAFERDAGFTNRLVLGYFKEEMFKQGNLVSRNTFKFLCESLKLYLQRKNTRMRETTTFEGVVAMALQRLGTRNILCHVGRYTRYNFKNYEKFLFIGTSSYATDFYTTSKSKLV